MFERLSARAVLLCERRVVRIIAGLAAIPLPPGIASEASEQGLRLSGRRLRRRLIESAAVRSFWR